MENIHTLSTDGSGTWYPLYTCRLLKVKHHRHSIYKKSIIERRAIQYIKDRTEYIERFSELVIDLYWQMHHKYSIFH
jgi:hypothetical protein